MLKHSRRSKGLLNSSMDYHNLSCSDIESSKESACRKAIEERVFQGNLVIGIGSGSTVVYAAKFIAESIQAIKKKAAEERRESDLNVICIPSSFQAKQLIYENNLTLGTLDDHPEVDWTVDGADEIDSENNLIKGGGGCHTQEKILAYASKEFYIVADITKSSNKLGTVWKKGIPIEVLPVSYINVKRRIENELGGEAVLRLAIAKAGPVITDNGNFILDWRFPENIPNNYGLPEIQIFIKMIPGVVEHGLFLNMATKVYVGSPDGEVNILSKSSDRKVKIPSKNS